MKRHICFVLLCMLYSAAFSAQTANPAAPAQAKASAGNLEAVLTSMDRAAAGFKSAEANFVWDQFTQVIQEHDFQKGAIYYRRSGNEVQMASDITEPAKKYVLFSGGKVQVYQPAIEQVTEYSAGKNKAEFESFLVIGFGGRGHDLQKSFDVRYDGTENVDGVEAAKLTLVPKSVKVHNMFQQIILWIDPARGVSVRQQFIEPSGDYRLAKYGNIKLNQKMPDDVFKLKTTGKTKVVRPQG
ncbi:MAG: outer membrane lipoprotein carrier protein LolA [Acidobacteriia bacterium]|nr:outer membrane lipoprotein carrier protein LolA [Terriglobia bacterium]